MVTDWRIMNTLQEKYATEIDELLGRYPEKRAAVMPMLYMAQEEYGYLTREAMHEVAEILELDPTEVFSVSEFYSLYYHEPVGKFVIRFCTDLPCALVGADDVFHYLLDVLDIEAGETTDDGLFTVESCVCLASCGTAPVMQINRQYFEHLTPETLETLIAQVREHELPPNTRGLRFRPREQEESI